MMMMRQLMQQNGYSLRKLSKITGISFSMLHKMSRGERRITLESAKVLAKALRCKTSDLYQPRKRRRQKNEATVLHG